MRRGQSVPYAPQKRGSDLVDLFEQPAGLALRSEGVPSTSVWRMYCI